MEQADSQHEEYYQHVNCGHAFVEYGRVLGSAGNDHGHQENKNKSQKIRVRSQARYIKRPNVFDKEFSNSSAGNGVDVLAAGAAERSCTDHIF